MSFVYRMRFATGVRDIPDFEVGSCYGMTEKWAKVMLIWQFENLEMRKCDYHDRLAFQPCRNLV